MERSHTQNNWLEINHARSKIYFLCFIFLTSAFFHNLTIAQTVDHEKYEKHIQHIGSSKIDDVDLDIIMVYRRDSALLLASISDNKSPIKYIPLMTFIDTRETMPMKLQIIASEKNDKIWIYFQNTANPKLKEFLTYYVLGSDTVLTSLGQKKLLDTPTPSHLSGVFQKVRGFQGEKVKTMAIFYFSGKEY